MRKIFCNILIVLATAPTFADELPCNLTAQDYMSLSASDAKLNQTSALTISREDQNMLCTTRYFWRKVEHDGSALNEVVLYDPKYLSQNEKILVEEAVNQFMKRKLAEKGLPVIN